MRAFGSEEYFHGPRLSRWRKDGIWHVAHQKDNRAAEIRSRASDRNVRFKPLAWVPALVELQWLALAVALNRGVDPDAC